MSVKPTAQVLTTCTIAAVLALGLFGSWAVVGAPANGATSFEKDIRPLLAAHCIKCHSNKKAKGGINLEAFTDEKSVLKARKVWKTVAKQLEAMEMPPAAEQPLPQERRELLLNWIKKTVSAVDCASAADRQPGKAVVRRLSRSEYDNTLRDLLGLPFDSRQAVGMPEEAVGAGFTNQADVLTLSPALMDKYFAAADKLLERLFAAKPEPAAQQALDALLVVKPGSPRENRPIARKILAAFVRRAYRRPVQDDEVERLLQLYDRAVARGGRFEDGLRLALKAVLVSPNFLLRLERDRATPGSDAAYRVDDHELAVRLSYFLWSSMPDDKLSALADQGKLADPAVLEAQVQRMLADPKARALTDDFAAQWLQLKKLAEARPSTEFFPTFTPQLRQALYDETATFFDKLREEDGSVFRLLDADYTYLNQELAKHYGLAGVEGAQLRKVALKPGDHRGGLLGMGSVLAMTSHTSRTSPTLRGKWVLEVIFGTPPPPPPPDAGKIDEEKAKGKDAQSFRELLAQHATRPACAGCHSKIDPLGFGLENFDAVGRWREGVRGLDASGSLPTGEKFNGPAELKRIIVQRQDEFTRNLAERLLSYALGREMEYYDECAVREVKSALEKDGHRFSALVKGIVKSYPFQHRRNTDAAD